MRPKAKFTPEDDAKAMRLLHAGVIQADIARRMGVDKSTIKAALERARARMEVIQ